jgi:hypothetical protein
LHHGVAVYPEGLPRSSGAGLLLLVRPEFSDRRRKKNDDHVPPKNAFDVPDRTPPLILKTHVTCNSAHRTTDELIGQLVALQRNYVTPDPKNRLLKMEVYPAQSFGAVTNVNVIEAVWRYIRGFHAALYREAIAGAPQGTITTPFTRAQLVNNELVLEGPKKGQHFAIVQTIKNQRALGNGDRIVSNNGKLTYECVWVWAGDVNAVTSGQRPMIPRRACFFALDIYAWKELGDVGQFPARGRAGAYFLPDGHAPVGASLCIEAAPVATNQDPWDPFGP